jgi:hypothetical protein
MAWTAARTWVTGELVTASIMNSAVRDNLDALKAPPSDDYTADEGSDYTETSTSFVDIDATNLDFTLVTGGGDVLVHFHGTFDHSAAGRVYLDVDVDGSRTAGDDGIVTAVASDPIVVTFTRLISGLSAGSHTFTLQWKTNAGTITLYAGAGTASYDLHPQFWAREIS